MAREELEDGKAHQTGRHGHDGHPSRLQAKVDIRSADDRAYGQAGDDAPDREAPTGRRRRCHVDDGAGSETQLG